MSVTLHIADLWVSGASFLTGGVSAEPCSTAGLLFLCQYLCLTILVTQCSMVWDWCVSRAGLMPFFGVAAAVFFSCCFPFLFFQSMGRYCGAGVFGLIVLIAPFQPCVVNLF